MRCALMQTKSYWLNHNSRRRRPRGRLAAAPHAVHCLFLLLVAWQLCDCVVFVAVCLLGSVCVLSLVCSFVCCSLCSLLVCAFSVEVLATPAPLADADTGAEAVCLSRFACWCCVGVCFLLFCWSVWLCVYARACSHVNVCCRLSVCISVFTCMGSYVLMNDFNAQTFKTKPTAVHRV